MSPGPSESTRRQFLTPLGTPSSSEPLAETSIPERATYLLEISRRAMACEFVVHLNAGQYPSGPEQAMVALDLLESLEQQMSVYRSDSDISQINSRAAAGAVPVNPQLFALLQRAVRIGQATGGAFDITSGPLVKTWGFYRRQGRMPADAQIQEALQMVGSKQIALDAGLQTVRFRRSGVEINLGAIGKGYALDCCGQWLRDQGIADFLIHGGFSSVLAGGQRAGANSSDGWLVAVRHPLRPRQAIAQVWLQDQALGTSGSGTQYFYHQGKRYGHILDPRSGRPVEGILSATAVTADAASADALSTAFYVLGVEGTEEYCRNHPDVAALIVTPGTKAGTVQLHALGCENLRWRSCDSLPA